MRNYSVSDDGRTMLRRPCSHLGCSQQDSLSCSKCDAAYCSLRCYVIDWSANHMKICPGVRPMVNGSASPRVEPSNGVRERDSPIAAGVASPLASRVRNSQGRGRRPSSQGEASSPLLVPAGGQSAGVQRSIPVSLARARSTADLYRANDRVRIVMCDGTGTWATNGVVFCRLTDASKVDIKPALDFIKAVPECEYSPVNRCVLGRGDRILVEVKLAAPLRATVLVLPGAGGAIVFLDDLGRVERLSPDARVACLQPNRTIPPLCFSMLGGAAGNISQEQNVKVEKISLVDKSICLVANDGRKIYVTKWEEDLAVPLTEDCLQVPTVHWILGSRFQGRIMWHFDRQNAVYVMEETDAQQVADLGEALRVYYEDAWKRIPPGGADPGEGEVGICEDPKGFVSRCIVRNLVRKGGVPYLKVQFLDLGVMDEVPASKFLRLPLHYAETADLTLFGAKVQLDIPDGYRLTTGAVESLREVLLSGKTVTIHVQTDLCRDGSFLIDVQDARTGESLLDLELLSSEPGEVDAASEPMWPEGVATDELPIGESVLMEVVGVPNEEDDMPYDLCAVPVTKGDLLAYEEANEAGRNAPEEAYEPRPNEIVLALDVDGRWYRAVGLAGNRVWFLDYGNVVAVTPEQVRRIPTELLAEPPFGYLFMIVGRERVVRQQKEKIQLAFENREPLMIKIQKMSEDEERVYEVDVL